MKEKSVAIHRLVVISICVAFITLCSWIAIPFPISFSLQIFAIFLTASVFPRSISVSAVLIYISLGLIGIPVFSGFSSGIPTILGPSGGYVLSFLPSVIIISFFSGNKHSSKAKKLIGMLLALLVCYACGCIWYIYVFCYPAGCSLLAALSVCVFPFIIFDIIKILLALIVSKKISQYVNRLSL